MIKEIQKKFIMTAMIAITILITIIISVINITNAYFITRQVEDTLELLTVTEGNYILIGNMDNEGPLSFYIPKPQKDVFYSSNFFVVWFDRNDDVYYVDVSRTPSVSKEEAIVLAIENYSEENIKGFNGDYAYAYQNTGFTNETYAIYLDTSYEVSAIIRVLLLSLGVGILGWLGMLMIVIPLSKKMIKPIATNIERQKEFITNAGHELKTPLAIIQTNTEAMEIFNGENKYSLNIKKQVSRLSSLMNNLLVLAKMQETSSKINMTSFNISSLLDDSINSFIESFKMRSIEVIKDIESDVNFKGDIENINRVFDVMLDNAYKYTSENGKLTVSLKTKDKKLYIIFKNTIDEVIEGDPNQLFERFYRNDKSHNQRGGFGIGLALAKNIIENHKGNIEANYKDSEISFEITLNC